MSLIFGGLLSLLITFLVEIKQKNSKRYLNLATRAFLFFIMFLIFFLIFPCYLKADRMIEIYSVDRRVAYHSEEEICEQMYWHENQFEDCMLQAKQMCWYAPDLTDGDKVKECFALATACFIELSTPPAKGITLLITTLSIYGYSALLEWNSINKKLMEAQYHWEMYEFYLEVFQALGDEE